MRTLDTEDTLGIKYLGVRYYITAVRFKALQTLVRLSPTPAHKVEWSYEDRLDEFWVDSTSPDFDWNSW